MLCKSGRQCLADSVCRNENHVYSSELDTEPEQYEQNLAKHRPVA